MQRRDLLLFMTRGNLLRLLQGLLRLHGHFVESQHVSLPHQTCSANSSKRGRHRPAPFFLYDRLWLTYRAPAAAACAPTFTLICFGFASSRFGIVSVRTPSLYSALIASEFTVFASE